MLQHFVGLIVGLRTKRAFAAGAPMSSKNQNLISDVASSSSQFALCSSMPSSAKSEIELQLLHCVHRV
jgi:hypothetical protein